MNNWGAMIDQRMQQQEPQQQKFGYGTEGFGFGTSAHVSRGPSRGSGPVLSPGQAPPPPKQQQQQQQQQGSGPVMAPGQGGSAPSPPATKPPANLPPPPGNLENDQRVHYAGEPLWDTANSTQWGAHTIYAPRQGDPNQNWWLPVKDMFGGQNIYRYNNGNWDVHTEAPLPAGQWQQGPMTGGGDMRNGVFQPLTGNPNLEWISPTQRLNR